MSFAHPTLENIEALMVKSVKLRTEGDRIGARACDSQLAAMVKKWAVLARPDDIIAAGNRVSELRDISRTIRGSASYAETPFEAAEEEELAKAVEARADKIQSILARLVNREIKN